MWKFARERVDEFKVWKGGKWIRNVGQEKEGENHRGDRGRYVVKKRRDVG